MTAATEFPAKSPALFLSAHALADPTFEAEFVKAVDANKPILMTSTLRAALPAKVQTQAAKPNVHILELKNKATKATTYGVLDSVRDLMNLSRDEVDGLRHTVLDFLGVELSAPTRVSLYLYTGHKLVVENFNDTAASVVLKVRSAKGFEKAVVLPPNADVKLESKGEEAKITLPARSLIALQAK